MSWKSPWTKPSVVDARAKALEEEAAALAREMEEMRQQMETLKNPPPAPPNQPIWKSHKTGEIPLATEVPLVPKKLTHRTHRAQQKQDRNLFIVLLILLTAVFLLVIHALR